MKINPALGINLKDYDPDNILRGKLWRITEKIDGVRRLFYKDKSGFITCYSRTGKTDKWLTHIASYLEGSNFPGEMIYDTELVDLELYIANVDSFANTHPRGYDMPIGERGEGLSGGQIQSVGLARACLFDYPINLFDEPTSSMDKQTEDIVLDNLNNFMKNKTLIVITQKMPLLRIVDKIIVLNNSTVYLQGEKEAVIKALSQGDGFEK